MRAKTQQIWLLLIIASAVEMLSVSDAVGQDAPQYGGELNIGTVYVTLSALSWDPVDWTWKSRTTEKCQQDPAKRVKRRDIRCSACGEIMPGQ